MGMSFGSTLRVCYQTCSSIEIVSTCGCGTVDWHYPCYHCLLIAIQIVRADVLDSLLHGDLTRAMATPYIMPLDFLKDEPLYRP